MFVFYEQNIDIRKRVRCGVISVYVWNAYSHHYTRSSASYAVVQLAEELSHFFASSHIFSHSALCAVCKNLWPGCTEHNLPINLLVAFSAVFGSVAFM